MAQHQSVWAGLGSVGILVMPWSLAHPGADDAAVRGRALYGQYCAVCHGAEGQGRIQGNATGLNNPDFLAVASDAFLQVTIAQGRRGTAMRGWAQEVGGPLSSDETHDPSAFLRTWQPEVSPPPFPPVGPGEPVGGQQLYEVACANCHGWDGRGNLGMGPAVTNPDLLAAADDAFLWATIAYGRRGTPMFPSLRGLDGVRQLSAQEINDLIAYLRSSQCQK